MRVFDEIFFSFTFGGEVVSLAAANTFLDIISDGKVLREISRHGDKFKESLQAIIDKNDLTDELKPVGHGSHWVLTLQTKGPESLLWRSYLIQECVKRGFLFFGSHNPSRAHDNRAMAMALSVYEEVLPLFHQGINQGDLSERMEGKIIDSIFRIHK